MAPVRCNKDLKSHFRSDSSSDDSDAEEFADGITMHTISTSSESEEEEEANNESEDQEDEDEDEIVKAIVAGKNLKRDHPPMIKIDDFIVDICFHPARDLIALATMLGDVLIYEYSNDECKLITTHELHVKACRDVEFNEDGTIMYTASKDKQIVGTDMATGKIIKYYEEAHDVPIYCLKCLDENQIVTGDDDGTVKLWDTRQPKPTFSIKLGDENISDMLTNEARKYLVCAAGDGILSTIDVRARKIYATSEEYDNELTCLGLFRTETKLLVGSMSGKLYLFNWKEFGLHSDEYVGQKHSISCMIPITQNIVVTSGEDGILRAAHMFPQRQLGIVGQHDLSVERLDISHDGKFIASSSHNDDVKFWNISYFEDIENIVDVSHKQNKKKEMGNNLPSSSFANPNDFFSGLA